MLHFCCCGGDKQVSECSAPLFPLLSSGWLSLTWSLVWHYWWAWRMHDKPWRYTDSVWEAGRIGDVPLRPQWSRKENSCKSDLSGQRAMKREVHTAVDSPKHLEHKDISCSETSPPGARQIWRFFSGICLCNGVFVCTRHHRRVKELRSLSLAL